MKDLRNLYAIFIALTLLFSLNGCGPTRPPEESEGHIVAKQVDKESVIPAPVSQTTLLPKPQIRPRLETYTVVVSDVPVKDLLFSMARDAELNLDIHDDIEGTVTLNAIDQTLPQILERISKQADIRYEVESNSLRVQADKPFLRIYKIDYVNMSRETKSSVSVATTLGSTGAGNISQNSSGGGASSSGKRGSNSSITEVNNKSNNKFWETLTKNIISLLSKDGDSNSEETGDNKSDDRVIVNKETNPKTHNRYM